METGQGLFYILCFKDVTFDDSLFLNKKLGTVSLVKPRRLSDSSVLIKTNNIHRIGPMYHFNFVFENLICELHLLSRHMSGVG